MSYDDLVRECTRIFLDGLISGEKLGSLVRRIADRVAHWAAFEKSSAK